MNESQVCRNQLQILRNELQTLRNKLQTLRSKLQKTNESQQTNESQKKNEPQKTFINNNESQHKKTINIIKTILEEFVYEKFIKEKFHTLRASKDMILLHSEYISIKGRKKKSGIDIGRDVISLHIKKHV